MKPKNIKMEKNNQVNIFAQILSIVCTIGQLGAALALIVLAIFAIAVPILGSKVEIEQNTISMFDSKVELAAVDNKLNITIVDETNSVPLGDFDFQIVIDYLEKNKTFLIISFEVAIIGSIVTTVLTFMVLDKAGKIFMRIKTEQSPFSEENTTAVAKIAKLLLVSYVVSVITSVISNGIILNTSGADLNLSALCTTLVVYVIAYVFEYGQSLELSKK